MYMIRSARVLLALLLSWGVSASAANLLTNPDFDTDVSAWNHSVGSDFPPGWDGTNGSPATGSARLDVSATTGASSDMYQCANIAGGQSVDLSIRGKGDTCGNTAGAITVYLSTFDQLNCASGYIAAVRAAASDTISGWNVYTLTGYALTPSVQSVSVSPRIDYGPFTASTAYFDHAELHLHDGSTPIPGVINADFDHGLCGWTNGSATYWDSTVGSPTAGSAGFGGLGGATHLDGGCLDIANQNIDAVVRSLGDDAAKQAASSYFVGLILNIWDQPGCTGTNLGHAQTSDTVEPRFGWNLHSLSDFALPGGAQSVSYALSTYPILLSLPLTVNMDHVYVGPHRLFSDGFE